MKRAWAAPLWAHAMALAVLLLLAMPFLRTHWQWSADEGAVLAQVQQLDDHGTWLVPVPAPNIDPDGAWFPIHLSERAPDGRFAPYPKLPAYPVVLSAATRLGGMTGVVALGVLGTVVAAWAAGRLAEQTAPRVGRLALWATGLATPLLFDAYLVIAHSLGAGAVGVAAVGAASWARNGRWSGLVGVVAGTAAVVLLRNEGILMVAAAVAVLGVVWLLRRGGRLLALPCVVGVSGAAAFLANRWAYRAIMGGLGGVAAPAAGDDGSFLRGRWDGFFQTMVQPGDRRLLALAAGLVIVAALAFRSKEERIRRLGPIAMVVALVVVVLSLATEQIDVVPGLFVVTPLLIVGLVLVRRDDLRAPASVGLAVAGVFWLAVLATQYRSGGSGEWGGRYFAIGLPLVMPTVAVVVARSCRDLAQRDVRIFVGALGVICAVLAGTALVTIAKFHDLTARVVDMVETTAADAPPGDGGSPVVVSTLAAIPRLSWREVPEGRWFLTLTKADLGAAFQALGDVDVDAATVVLYPSYDDPDIPGWTTHPGRSVAEGFRTVVMTRDGA